MLCYKEEKKVKRGYRIQMVEPAAKALVVGQLIAGNSMRQVSAVIVLPSLEGLVPKPNK